MEIHIVNTFCFRLPLRTGCLVIGWFDIVYGHALVLFYLASMYSGNFHMSGVYHFALGLDFVFTIVQLLGGAILVYGVKYKTVGLLLVSSIIGVLLMLSDVVGDVLLSLSFPQNPLNLNLLAGALLLTFICMRGYMTFAVYCYYEQVREEIFLRNKIYETIPEIVRRMSLNNQ